SPSGNENMFFTKLESLLTDLTNHHLDYILMGGFNINVLDNNQQTTKRLANLLRLFDLELLVKTPTRVTATTKSAIDNVISNLPNVAVSVIKIGDRLLDDETEVANEFNKFYATVACDQGPRPSAPLANSTRRQIPSASIGLAPVDVKELGTSLRGAVQLAGAPMWPLQRLPTTDENAFLRMIGWRSTYTSSSCSGRMGRSSPTERKIGDGGAPPANYR
ncbi:hypothetical protein J6590_051487, partial [Homalodisca vitripennis]